MYKCNEDQLPKIKAEIEKFAEFYEVNERGVKPYFFPQVEDLMRFKT